MTKAQYIRVRTSPQGGYSEFKTKECSQLGILVQSIEMDENNNATLLFKDNKRKTIMSSEIINFLHL